MKRALMVFIFSTFLLPTFLVAQTIVYQDNFDSDGVGVNTGIGGPGTTSSFNGSPAWVDNGDLDGGTAGEGFHLWFFSSFNTFEVNDGFTLEVEFDQQFIDYQGDNSVAPFFSNHFSFGLATTNQSTSLLNTNGAVPAVEAIGVSSVSYTHLTLPTTPYV